MDSMPSVHTCKTYMQHKVFRLGDIVKYQGDQIFEKIERAGISMYRCISPMNASNKYEKTSIFYSDPWTNTTPDSSFTSKVIHLAIKQLL